jgi:hypothetical protein
MFDWTNNVYSVLFIFDLDNTLIPEHKVLMYKQVKGILDVLFKKHVKMAIASYNSQCEFFLKKNDIQDYFECIQGYHKSTKHQHIQNILDKYKNIPKSNIYFFDDCKSNVEYVSKTFSISCVLVNGKIGVTFYNIVDALLEQAPKEKNDKKKEYIQNVISDLFFNQ